MLGDVIFLADLNFTGCIEVKAPDSDLAGLSSGVPQQTKGY